MYFVFCFFFSLLFWGMSPFSGDCSTVYENKFSFRSFLSRTFSLVRLNAVWYAIIIEERMRYSENVEYDFWARKPPSIFIHHLIFKDHSFFLSVFFEHFENFIFFFMNFNTKISSWHENCNLNRLSIIQEKKIGKKLFSLTFYDFQIHSDGWFQEIWFIIGL